MANIQQAAKWMQEGKNVRRNSANNEWWIGAHEPRRLTWWVGTHNGWDRELTLPDLLADDWEIVHD